MIVLTATYRRLGMVFACILAASTIGIPLAQASLHRITEHSQGQTTSADKYGPLDPWAYALLHRVGGSRGNITEHSLGQNGSAASDSSASSSAPVAQPSGFDWGDASIGGVATFGVLLLAGVMAIVAGRRRRTVARIS